MNNSNFYQEDHKNRKIFFQQWLPNIPVKGVIALVHGLGEHSGRYGRMAEFYTSKGLAVIAIDLYGHGLTEGKKGHVDSMEAFMEQLSVLTEKTKVLASGKPVFLYGHSMGGNLVLNYLFRNKPDIQGVIASAPAVKPGFEPPKIKILIGKIGRAIAPSFTQPNGLELAALSRDVAVVAAYIADPLVHNQLSGVLGLGILEWGEWLLKNPKNASIPVLFMHGTADRLTNFEASKQLASQLSGDVTFNACEGMYHEIHNESDKQVVFDFTHNWIVQHS